MYSLMTALTNSTARGEASSALLLGGASVHTFASATPGLGLAIHLETINIKDIGFGVQRTGYLNLLIVVLLTHQVL